MKAIMTSAILLAVALTAAPSDKLLDAIAVVESHNKDNAVNVKEAAVGRYQIRPGYLKEVNRIQGMRKGALYQYQDRLDPVKARQMVRIYLVFWGEQYRKVTGKAPTDEVYAKIHNGHAFWTKGQSCADRLQYYWGKIQRVMK